MKTLLMAATALLGATALGSAFSAPAEAQTYRAAPDSYGQCIAQQRQRQVAGAVIGGILGAVVGAELHDDSQDRNRDRRRYGSRHDRYGYDHYDRYDRYDRNDRRHREAGNDGAVVAGGAVGALAGAAIASGDCERLHPGRRGDARYGHDPRYRDSRYGHDPRYSQDRYGRDPYRDSGYGNQDPYYEDPYYADRGYEDSRRWSTQQDELLGGRGYEREAPFDSRRYQAGQAITASQNYGAGSDCRYMESAGQSTLMCQGSDGIWRPANTYR